MGNAAIAGMSGSGAAQSGGQQSSAPDPNNVLSVYNAQGAANSSYGVGETVAMQQAADSGYSFAALSGVGIYRDAVSTEQGGSQLASMPGYLSSLDTNVDGTPHLTDGHETVNLTPMQVSANATDDTSEQGTPFYPAMTTEESLSLQAGSASVAQHRLADTYAAQDREANLNAWQQQDAKQFVGFNGKIAFAGATGGLVSAVPLLAGAYEGARTFSLWQFALATRAGAGVIGAGVDAANQGVQGLLTPGYQYHWTNTVMAGLTSSLGVGGGWAWNVAVNAAGGTIQSSANNYFFNENNNVVLDGVAAGVAGGAGYKIGDSTFSYLNQSAPKSLVPVIIGNGVGSTVNSLVGNAYNAAIDQSKPSPGR